jgi:iron-sulfur cluster assembly protein
MPPARLYPASQTGGAVKRVSSTLYRSPETVVQISITPRAVERILKTAESEGVNLDTDVLRVAAVAGGCSGLTYDLGWDSERKESDEEVEIEGIRVVMDLKSRLYIEGSELDFSDGLDGKGFHFTNPNAVRTCACGESFGL